MKIKIVIVFFISIFSNFAFATGKLIYVSDNVTLLSALVKQERVGKAFLVGSDVLVGDNIELKQTGVAKILFDNAVIDLFSEASVYFNNLKEEKSAGLKLNQGSIYVSIGEQNPNYAFRIDVGTKLIIIKSGSVFLSYSKNDDKLTAIAFDARANIWINNIRTAEQPSVVLSSGNKIIIEKEKIFNAEKVANSNMNEFRIDKYFVQGEIESFLPFEVKNVAWKIDSKFSVLDNYNAFIPVKYETSFKTKVNLKVIRE